MSVISRHSSPALPGAFPGTSVVGRDRLCDSRRGDAPPAAPPHVTRGRPSRRPRAATTRSCSIACLDRSSPTPPSARGPCFGAWFQEDDFEFLRFSREEPLTLDYLMDAAHGAPDAARRGWSSTSRSPAGLFNWQATAAVTVAFQAAVGLSVFWMLRDPLRSPLGHRPAAAGLLLLRDHHAGHGVVGRRDQPAGPADRPHVRGRVLGAARAHRARTLARAGARQRRLWRWPPTSGAWRSCRSLPRSPTAGSRPARPCGACVAMVRRLWWAGLVGGVIGVGTIAYYAAYVPLETLDRDWGLLGPLASDMLGTAYLSGVVGGPWDWYAPVPPPAFAAPPVWLAQLSWVVIAGVAAHAFLTRRRTLRAWGLLLGYLVILLLLLWSSRAPTSERWRARSTATSPTRPRCRPSPSAWPTSRSPVRPARSEPRSAPLLTAAHPGRGARCAGPRRRGLGDLVVDRLRPDLARLHARHATTCARSTPSSPRPGPSPLADTGLPPEVVAPDHLDRGPAPPAGRDAVPRVPLPRRRARAGRGRRRRPPRVGRPRHRADDAARRRRELRVADRQRVRADPPRRTGARGRMVDAGQLPRRSRRAP